MEDANRNFKLANGTVLTEEEIKDIISIGLEGGIGYWAKLDNEEDSYVKAKEKLKAANQKAGHEDPRPTYDEVIFELLVSGKSAAFILNDPDSDYPDEDEDGVVCKLTKEKFITGCENYERHFGSIQKALDDGNFDADDGDIIYQFALFNEIVYG